MDAALPAVIIAGTTLLFNVFIHMFGGGWRVSGRLATIEAGMAGIQVELSKLGSVLVEIAKVGGDVRALGERLTALEQRQLATEKDIRELRHGEGFIRGARGIDREFS